MNEINEYKNAVIKLVNYGYQVILFHQGLGETCIFVLLMKTYRAVYNKPLVVLALQNSRKQILECCPDIDEVIECNPAFYYTISWDTEFRKQYGIKDFLELHYMFNDSNIKNRVCRFLNIPNNSEYSKFTILTNHTDALMNLFSRFDLTMQRVVFIIPSAIRYGDKVVTHQYWEKLVEEINKTGRKVFFNSVTPIVEGEAFGYLEMRDLIEFVSMCGNVVGVRTGLLDFIAVFSNVRIQVIFPNEKCPVWFENPAFSNQTPGGKANIDPVQLAHEAYENMRIEEMFERDNIIEFIHRNDDAEILRVVENLQ